jgi:hypothetical protein
MIARRGHEPNSCGLDACGRQVCFVDRINRVSRCIKESCGFSLTGRNVGLDQWRSKLDAEDFGAQGRIQVPDLQMLPVILSIGAPGVVRA